MEGGSDTVARACREMTAACGPLSIWKWWFPLRRPSSGARGQPPLGSRVCATTSPTGWRPQDFSPRPCDGVPPSFSSYTDRARPFSSTDSGSRRNSSPCSPSSTATFQPGCWQQYLTSLPRVLLLVSQAAFSPRLDWCPGFTSAEG